MFKKPLDHRPIYIYLYITIITTGMVLCINVILIYNMGTHADNSLPYLEIIINVHFVNVSNLSQYNINHKY